MNGICNTFDLLNVLKKNRIIIYGTGFVARLFYEALAHHKIEQSIKCFVVSDPIPRDRIFKELPVVSVQSLIEKEDEIICIAVHEVIRGEIETVLLNKGITSYVWIYPYLFEMMMGQPLIKGKEFLVDDIIRQCLDYRIAIRYLAIENYYHHNNNGFFIYKKAQTLYMNETTAEHRVEQFKLLIQKWENDGYCKEYPILVDERSKILDGNHRITLAKYFGIKKVKCDVYKCQSQYAGWIGADAMFEKNVIMNAGFSEADLNEIEAVYQKIRV